MSPPQTRSQELAYRLVEAPGLPHQILDEHYGSQEEAWVEAQDWWKGCRGDRHRTCTLGIEVSTSSGDWRTLCYQACGYRGRPECIPGACR